MTRPIILYIGRIRMYHLCFTEITSGKCFNAYHLDLGHYLKPSYKMKAWWRRA